MKKLFLSRFLVMSLLCGYAVGACAVFGARTVAAADVDYFTDNGLDNAVASIQHPSAEQFNGTTYIAYQGPHEDPYVCVYNHAKKLWQGPVKAGVSWLGLTPDPTDRKEIDNHGKPALTVDSKGYVHLVFGGHGGLATLGENLYGTPGSGRQVHVVSKNPEDISSWEALDNIDPFGTYDQFLKMANGDLYLFYRHGSHRSDWVYQKSTDDGRTFAPPVSVLKHKAQENDPNTHDAWYAWFNAADGNTITVQYIYH
ncbi:MAG: BNR-4 repeat-containing protein, partial [Planctomycetota bacterium]